MDPITVTIEIAKYAAYACAISTIALKLLPTPEDTVKIFILTVPPKHYIIFFNILRWISGNKSWMERPDKKNGKSNAN